MIKFFALAAVLSTVPGQASANPACAVCTIAFGGWLEFVRILGVDDAIVGLWAGALLTLLGYWTIVFFDKKNWHFAGRNFWLIFISVSMFGFVYLHEIVYSPKVIWHIFYLDPMLFSALLGMIVYILSQKFYRQVKARNGGHAHFPFEKVVLPLGLLMGFSLYFTYYPI